MEDDTMITVQVHENSKEPFFKSVKSKVKGFFSGFNSRKKIITTVLGIFILTGALGVGAYLVQTANKRTSATGPILTLSSNSINPQVGQTITVAVALDTQGMRVCGSDLEIKYDPNLLTATSWQAGTFLPVVLTPAANSNSTLTITVGCDPTAPKTGTGILATAIFTAKANGAATLSFGSGTDIAAIGQQGNVLGTANPITINIGNVPSGSPTISPTPTTPPGPIVTPTATPTVRPSPTATPACKPAGAACGGQSDTSCCAPAVCRAPAGSFYCRILPND